MNNFEVDELVTSSNYKNLENELKNLEINIK